MTTPPVITDRRAAIIRAHAFAGEPNRLHTITTEALAELLDPTPAELAPRVIQALAYDDDEYGVGV